MVNVLPVLYTEQCLFLSLCCAPCWPCACPEHATVPTVCACVTLMLSMLQIEARFRFLAADSTATIRGKRPSYREVLLLIRDRCVLRVVHPGQHCKLCTQVSSSGVSSRTAAQQWNTTTWSPMSRALSCARVQRNILLSWYVHALQVGHQALMHLSCTRAE
jgi:hypothetical protein